MASQNRQRRTLIIPGEASGNCKGPKSKAAPETGTASFGLQARLNRTQDYPAQSPFFSNQRNMPSAKTIITTTISQ